MFYECIQFLILQQLKLNKFRDSDGLLLKMFEKILHMFPGLILKSFFYHLLKKLLLIFNHLFQIICPVGFHFHNCSKTMNKMIKASNKYQKISKRLSRQTLKQNFLKFSLQKFLFLVHVFFCSFIVMITLLIYFI